MSEKKKINANVGKQKEKFPCNRPSHKKGKVPTKNELDYRRTRDGD